MIGDQTLVYYHNKKVTYQYADPLHLKVSSVDRCFIQTKKCNKKSTGLRDETNWSFMFVIAYNVFSIMNAAEHLTLETVCSDVLINFNSHDISVFLVN